MTNAITTSTTSDDDQILMPTLYERLGGDAMMNIIVWSFFDELVEHPDMKPFFKNIAMVAMKTHTVKLFKIMFGTLDEQPEEEDLLEYLLRTHTRLFRDMGLDETHFDTLAGCFVQGLQGFQVSQDLIDECVAVMAPLRVVFEYGAKLAKQEKEMDPKELRSLPVASAGTIGTDEAVTLPVISDIVIPDWLPRALAGGKDGATEETVRKWTCELTDRFGAEGDSEIADTYLDQPYMDHHIYNVAFLQLAFLPEDTDRSHRQKLLEIVIYPRGRDCPKLSRRLFDRMVDQFGLACTRLGMSIHHSRPAEDRLRTYRSAFGGKTVKVNGATRPHFLSKKLKQQEEARANEEGGGSEQQDPATSPSSKSKDKTKRDRSSPKNNNKKKKKNPFTKLFSMEDDDLTSVMSSSVMSASMTSSCSSNNGNSSEQAPPLRRNKSNTTNKASKIGHSILRKVGLASPRPATSVAKPA